MMVYGAMGIGIWEVIEAAKTKPFGFIADALNARSKAVRGSRILILGLAYKPNVDDERESPSYLLMSLLVGFATQ